MRLNIKLILSLMALSSIVLSQNCSQIRFTSSAEADATQQVVFFDPQSVVNGVSGANGLPTENLRISSLDEAGKSMVKDCSAPVLLANGTALDRYSWERNQALKKASEDKNNKTIPVEFAISFGDKEDRLAVWAHKRAILSDSNWGYSIIPIGAKDSSQGPGGTSGYYITDHNDAKNDYINGERCFFDTVKITDHKIMKGHYDFLQSAETDSDLIHKIHYMFYGWCDPSATSKCASAESVYGTGHYGNDSYPNRLFSTLPATDQNGKPQVVKLYIADLRTGQFGVNTNGKSIISVTEGTARGSEVQLDLLKQMDIRTIYRNTNSVIRNLSREYKSHETHEVFSGMRGVPQLIHNLLVEGMDGTILASQYTPIVLDLGKPQIRTSDTFGGTLFNMSATKDPKASDLNSAYDILELTSWIGGDLVDTQAKSELVDGFKFPMDVRRVADDGFLTLPDTEGKIRSSLNLFGDKIEINGRSYANGFLALQAYAKKDCSSSDLKMRYLGPWDPSYRIIKVWVDANRNGVVDDGELMSLEAAGVSALNTCNIVDVQERDQFGNGSALRSAFLYSPNEKLNESEILNRLKTGETSIKAKAEFRVAIDLIFQTKTSIAARANQK